MVLDNLHKRQHMTCREPLNYNLNGSQEFWRSDKAVWVI